MKLTVLVDNNTYIDKYYLGEPALSIYIENADDRILFDLGYSDVFKKNAEKMDINLNQVNKLVFSHGHIDHTGGLKYLNDKKREIISHPYTFLERYDNVEHYGSQIPESEISNYGTKIYQEEPYLISENLYFLGKIPMINSFEKPEILGNIIINNEICDDYTEDDSAIVYDGIDGLVIITGCSHSGICNIIEYAKKVTNKNIVKTVIGGFHLFEDNDRVHKTIKYFLDNDINDISPCHCTSLKVKHKLQSHLKVNEIGVSFSSEFK